MNKLIKLQAFEKTLKAIINKILDYKRLPCMLTMCICTSGTKANTSHRRFWSRQNLPKRTSTVQGLGLRGRLCSLQRGHSSLDGRWSMQLLFLKNWLTSRWYSLVHGHEETRYYEAGMSCEDRIHMYTMRQYVRWCLHQAMKQHMYRLWRYPCRSKRWKLHQDNSMMRAMPLRTSSTVLRGKRFGGLEPQNHDRRGSDFQVASRKERRLNDTGGDDKAGLFVGQYQLISVPQQNHKKKGKQMGVGPKNP